MLLELNFGPVPVQGRANPTGGENGDGSLVGTDNENTISDLTIFFYEAADGISAANNTPVAYSVFVDDNIIKNAANGYYVMVPVDVDADVRNAHHVIIAANFGDLTNLATLGAVRDYVKSGHSWRTADVPANCTYFAMANAGDSQIFKKAGTLNYAGQKWNYSHYGTARLERLAARVDLLYNSAQYDRTQQALKYSVNEYTEDWAWVYLKNAQLFNVPVNSSYLIKRTSRGSILGSWIYLGEETSADGIATNYVLDPKTRQKSTSLSLTETNQWYGNTAAGLVEYNYPSVFGAGSGNDIETLQKYYRTNAVNAGYERFFSIGYSEENVQNLNAMTAQYVTGFLIKAVYQPRNVYKDVDSSNEPVLNTAYRIGQSFWLVTAHSSFETEKFSRYYFSNSAAANKYADFLRQKDDDYVTVSAYTNGVCYYTVWLRHSSREERYPDIHQYCPMEFAVVRNNVYQVGLTFHGPGTISPRIDDPQSIRPEIYVREWYLREHGQIAM